MPATETDSHYVTRLLFDRLPDNEGNPLLVADERDITIVNDGRFFEDVASRARGKSGQEALPGLEIDPEAIKRKEQQGVAVARTGKGVMYLERIMMSTYAEDTCRSLFRLARSGTFIPIDEDDTSDSLYLRTGDYVENLFAAAALARIPLSKYTRDKGVSELTKRYNDREQSTVLDLAVLTGRNNARLRGMWLNQLATTTKGFRYLPKPAKDMFTNYAVTRPAAYMQTPDLLQLVADRSQPKRSAKSAS